jgi:hypothetical protein
VQTITVGTTDGTASAVQGIEPGAVVAADNFTRLTDGAKVALRPSTNETGRAEGQKQNRGKKPPS